MLRLEIFNAGRHTSSQKSTRTWSHSELDEVVDTYNPDVFKAPLMLSKTKGHSTDGIPDKVLAFSELAFGYPESLERVGDKLYGLFERVAPEFTEWVKQGRILDRSASFYPPDSSANPYPGKWALRHVAALGVTPPAVKGMADMPGAFAAANFALDFSEDADVEDFEDYSCEMCMGASSMQILTSLMQRQRDALIADKGVEVAEASYPIDLINQMTRDNERSSRYINVTWEEWSTLQDRIYQLARTVEELCEGKAGESGGEARVVLRSSMQYSGTEETPMKTYKDMLAEAEITEVNGISAEDLQAIIDGTTKPNKFQKSMLAGALDVTTEELDMSEPSDSDLEIARLRTQLNQMTARDTRNQVHSFVENLSTQSQRRVRPAEVDELVEFALSLDDSEPIEFAQGTAIKTTARQRYLNQLASRPPAWGSNGKMPTDPSQDPAAAGIATLQTSSISYTEESTKLDQLVRQRLIAAGKDPESIGPDYAEAVVVVERQLAAQRG
jgi:hypothetical protein